MKIILQLEAKTISNSELAKNQQDLINLISKLIHFNFGLSNKTKKAKCSS